MDRRLLTYDPQFELLASSSPQSIVAGTPAIERDVSGELQEVGLTSQFLEIKDERGLTQFLHQLYASLAKGGRSIDEKAVLGLMRHLIEIAKSFRFGSGPRLARQIDTSERALIRRPSAESLFGSELEGLSPEDRDFYTGRAFIRLAIEAMKQLRKPEAAAHPAARAQLALLNAAQQHAPGLSNRRS